MRAPTFILLQYREDEAAAAAANLMFDRRVVRGNTYAARILPTDVVLTEKKGTASSSM